MNILNDVIKIEKKDILNKMSFKENLELKIWKSTMKKNHKDISMPDRYTELDSFIEKNEIKLHEFTCMGATHDYLFKEIIDRKKPKTIIEVGSALGYSACKMAEFNKRHRNDFAIICIDTWINDIGYTEYWDARLFGQPVMHYNFLKNIKDQKHTDVIIPYQFDSINAFLFLKQSDVYADVIYIDAAHDELSVYLDVINYYNLLKTDGIIFGDDWAWESVRKGVFKACDELSIRNKLKISKDGCWIIGL
jgi:predicted O-methyltransferase YrrM